MDTQQKDTMSTEEEVQIAPTNGDEEKEAYWNRVFTGDLRSVPQDVREKAGVPLSLSEDDDGRLAGRVVRSWAADHLSLSKEEIGSDWGQIRRNVARELGSGEDDREIFMALSERRRIQKQDRDQLSGVYSESYDSAFKEGDKGRGLKEGWKNVLPERLHSLGAQLRERAASEAYDDRARLVPVLEKFEKGVNSLVDLQVPSSSGEVSLKSYWDSRVDLKMLAAAPSIISAVSSMSELDDADRRKVYGMLVKKSQMNGGMGVRSLMALQQGAFDVVYNTAHLGMNVYAMGVKGLGNDMKRLAGVPNDWAEKHAGNVRDASRIFEELKQYVRTEAAPLHDKGDSLAEQMLLDGLSSAAPAALAFTGPAGIGLMAASDVGRSMAEAREMNPNGDYESQMGAAVFSGLANSALSVGMTKLGQKVVGSSLKTFKEFKGASGGVLPSARALGVGMGRTVGNLGAMSAENKAQELVQYGAQEVAAEMSGKESGVSWEDWMERNSDPSMQAREAAGLFPFLLIAAGRAGLRHFRNPNALLSEGSPLSKFGVSDEITAQIVAEPNVERKTALIREAIRSQPMWGSLFLGRKAFEWAKIIENPEKPLFSSEIEAREFLNMGAERIQKPWERSNLPKLAQERGVTPPKPSMNGSVARERWLMRSGIPKSKRGEALQNWESQERSEERISIGNIRNRYASVPDGVRDSEVFSPVADRARREFLASRLEEIGRRSYKALLLRYRDGDSLPNGYEHWDAITSDASFGMKNLIAKGAVELAGGKSWDEVRDGMSFKWWRNWLGDEGEPDRRIVDWLKSAVELIPEEKRWAVPLSRGFVEETNSGDVGKLREALSEMERYAADSSDSFREALPSDFRAALRLAWGDQSDVRLLAKLIPNLHEFDVMASRGLTPERSFESVLNRHLEIPDSSETVIAREEKPIGYAWMGGVMKRLQKVTPGLMESTQGVEGKKLWRIRYPNGEPSAWHAGRKDAWNDMAAHLSMVYSPVGRSREAMIGDWRSSRANDVVVSRIREGMEKRTLMDDLAVRATADLVSQGYGRRSYRAPGDELVLHHGDEAVSLEEIMGRQGVSGRKEIYEKYVGPAAGLAAEASNIDVDNAKGLIVNRLELYRKSSPLGMIEDRAEVVWDRLLRTGQLDAKTAWKMLTDMRRCRERKSGDVYGDYVRLSEELSQLSKEWYLGHLDDPSVPPSAAMWVRYSLARPLPTDAQIAKSRSHVAGLMNIPEGKRNRVDERRLDEWSDWSMTEEMRRLADAARTLPDEVVKSNLSSRLVSMLADSVGMNRNTRVERFWALSGQAEDSVLPMMERYAHSLTEGNLLDVVPKHVAEDLVQILGRDVKGKGFIFSNSEKSARKALSELAENLRQYPDIALWNPNSEMQGNYFVLKEKNYPSFEETQRGGFRLWERRLDPARVIEPAKIDHDWIMENRNALPESWRGNVSIARSIAILGLIRGDFSSRPVPSERGIYWKGELLRHDAPAAPGGVPDSWIRDVPLGSGLEAIFHLDRSGEIPKGAHYPLIHDWKEALNRYDNCALYIDPEDHSHTIRLMPGMPESALREARSPYVVHARDGVFFDESGRSVRDYRDSYIPLERFHFLYPVEEMSPKQRRDMKLQNRQKLLAEIVDPELQKKFWWDAHSGEGGFSESVIRLYEELGIRLDYEQGRLKLADPAFVESLRFVSHVINSPKWLAGGFEYGTPSHNVILEEGKAWKIVLGESVDYQGKK